MADDEMFEQCLEGFRKAGHLSYLRLQHFQLDDHVPEELAFGCVGERAVVSQFVNLADIVQKNTSENQIAVDLRIILTQQIAGASQRYHVVEQAANIGVMQRLRCWSVTISCSNCGIRHECLYQRLKVRILKRDDKCGQGPPQFVDIFRGLGKIVVKFDFGVAQLPQLVHVQLKTIFIFVDQTLDLEEVILLKGV